MVIQVVLSGTILGDWAFVPPEAFIISIFMPVVTSAATMLAIRIPTKIALIVAVEGTPEVSIVNKSSVFKTADAL